MIKEEALGPDHPCSPPTNSADVTNASPNWLPATGSLHRRTGGLATGNAGHFPQSTSAYYLKLLETAAPSLALKLKALPVSTAGEI